jgi:hypothetical protein
VVIPSAMPLVEDQPVLGDPLHPGAGVGDDLAAREQPVVAPAQRAEQAQPALPLLLTLLISLTWLTWLSFS